MGGCCGSSWVSGDSVETEPHSVSRSTPCCACLLTPGRPALLRLMRDSTTTRTCGGCRTA